MELGSILCVDDSPVNRRILGQLVTSLGYRAVEAENAQKALELLHQQDFELILLDLRLPDLSGSDLLSQLKAQSHTQAIPVIMVSSAEDSQSVVTCLERGAEDYLIKPYEPTVLKARVRAVMERERRPKGAKTGLFEGELLTRMAALEFLRRLVAGSLRYRQPLTLVMLESSAPQAAEYLSRGVRACDVACAYGRQQFLLGCPGRTPEQLVGLLTRLQKEIGARCVCLDLQAREPEAADLSTCLQELDRQLHQPHQAPVPKGRLF